MIEKTQTLWQASVEAGMETGQTPLLDLGLSPGILPSLPALLALISFAEERLDLTQPRVVVGGEGSGWLLALLFTPQTAPPQQAPALAITYGGADLATQVASVGIMQSPALLLPSQRRALPRSLAAWFAPTEHAGAASWSAFVFGVVNAAENTLERWLPWAGLLLAVGLVLLALLV